MRALLIAGATAAALVGLTGCGQETDPSGSAAAPRQTTEPESTLAKPAPPAPTDVTPTHPDIKPQDPPPGEAKPPGATPSAPVSMSPDGPVVPAGVEQVPSSQVDASAVPEYYDHRGEVWVYDNGYSLQMFAAASSGCGGVEAKIVDQSATEVRLTLRPMPEPQGGPADGPACTAVITPRPVTVALDAPLADRKIFIAGGR